MSILIKGMEMPKSCAECRLTDGVICYGTADENDDYILGEETYAIQRARFCPLVEIPTPHGRLIDADKLRAEFNRTESGYCGSWEFCDKPEDFQFLIDDEPTILEAERKSNEGTTE